MFRQRNAQIAFETLNVLKVGFYESKGNVISFQNEMREAVENSILFAPEDFSKLFSFPANENGLEFENERWSKGKGKGKVDEGNESRNVEIKGKGKEKEKIETTQDSTKKENVVLGGNRKQRREALQKMKQEQEANQSQQQQQQSQEQNQNQNQNQNPSNSSQPLQIIEPKSLTSSSSSSSSSSSTSTSTLFETKITVSTETTLMAARRLAKETVPISFTSQSQKKVNSLGGKQEKLLSYRPKSTVGVLNFASAKNPGGGFIKGSQAQEESLARSSALYPCIQQMKTMYEANLKSTSCAYYHYMIFSPDVPVFRDDHGNYHSDFYTVSFLSAPAVNAGIVRERIPNAEEIIRSQMRQRIDRMLTIFQHYSTQVLVLGAFGCGVFKNNSNEVAEMFRSLLKGKYKNVFQHVHFAIIEEDRASAWRQILSK